MPEYQKLHENSDKLGADFISVNVVNSKEEIGRFMRARGFTFPVVMDTPLRREDIDEGLVHQSAVAKLYGVEAYPTTVVVGTDSRITGWFNMARYSDLEKEIERANRLSHPD